MMGGMMGISKEHSGATTLALAALDALSALESSGAL